VLGPSGPTPSRPYYTDDLGLFSDELSGLFYPIHTARPVLLFHTIKEIPQLKMWHFACDNVGRGMHLRKTNVPDDESCVLVLAVANEIMTYLKKNTLAGDTARGVYQWWLTSSRARADVTTVEMALERLVAEGVVGVRVLASGERFYFGLGAQDGGRP
jgi:hypothetical protein